MDRYQNVVKIGLFGHVHSGGFNVVRSIKDQKNIGFNFVSPSVTTDSDNNPSFTIHEFDVETMALVSLKTYYASITDANINGEPKWQLL